MRKDDIKSFVKQTLGCTCPDEVFERIDCEGGVKLPGGIELDYRIVIGDRLLIFVVGIDQFGSLAGVLPRLVTAGTQERDANGLNRFRLVLLTHHPDRIAEKASNIFNSLKSDQKTHLHIIAKDDFPIRHT
ncbi:MAG: hypothetical protein ACYS8Z_12300 [Planctomycetota bacterium]|jgi:hypothetical protein